MENSEPVEAVARRIKETFAAHGVRLTLGGEPTYVPVDPSGLEWSITALGPTKLRYGYTLAEALITDTLPHALPIYSPGKLYPGELNPRWAINLLWNRDGSPLTPALGEPLLPARTPDRLGLELVKAELLQSLDLDHGWLVGVDPLDADQAVAVLPLDHDGKRFLSADWQLGDSLELLRTEGPAGLRLPLNLVPHEVSRRALTLEIRDEQYRVFLPPLLQEPLLAVIENIARALRNAASGPINWSGYIPIDEAGLWEKMAIASDPGVLEVNLPACAEWHDYRHWLEVLERTAAAAGLRSYKQPTEEEQTGTGGGNHLVFGGPNLEANPLFTHPQWITSILRYWQHHPALAYLFTGIYVGSSSQAPRPDEGASALYDLEMAYQFLEQLPPGDHRYLISETLRHLHTDTSGNTHRSESSFDKFWNVNYDGGCRGLVEFRAVESLPHAEWMSAVALLWQSLAAFLLQKPFTQPLLDHGEKLHDFYFLPSRLWADFSLILEDLRQSGFVLPPGLYREIFEWRFPVMLEMGSGGGTLLVRKGHEGWPLLCEQPLEGGNTSRFVDTSIERLEFVADTAFRDHSQLHIQGRHLPLLPMEDGQFGAGLRYRRTALYPSLHPGIPPQMPLRLTVTRAGQQQSFVLHENRRKFESDAASVVAAESESPCRKLHPSLLTYDLRIP